MLQISLAAIADAANISREGKLNITGIFGNINIVNFPAQHPWMVLVFVIDGEKSDAESEHKLKIDLIDEDGNLLIPSLQGNIKFGPVIQGGKIHAPQIYQFSNVQFKKAGMHEFKILLNGEVRATVPIDVTKIDKQK